MAADPAYCICCDEFLGDPPPSDEGSQIRRCAPCQAAIGAYLAALDDRATMPPPQFRGAIGLGVALAGWPTDIALVDLQVWDRFCELNVIEVPGPNPPPPHPRGIWGGSFGAQPPQGWTITTDVGTVHTGHMGGGGTPGTDRLLGWHADLAPSPPADAGRLEFRAVAPGARGEVSVDLAAHPLVRQDAEVSVVEAWDDSDPTCPSCGPPPPPVPPPPSPEPGLELDWAMAEPSEPSPDACRVEDPRPLCATCRSNSTPVCNAKVPVAPMPDRVVALGADLGAPFGDLLVIPAVSVWRTWFDLSVVGHTTGAWGKAFRTSKRAQRWKAHDDRGNHYVGAVLSGSSHLGLASEDISFIPALAPNATTLTVSFPPAFDGRSLDATVTLA